MHEMAYHDEAVFITLTYSDENLPLDMSLNKEVFKRFMKRLRKWAVSHYEEKLKTPDPEGSVLMGSYLKYFACGEYGEKYGRPHYHLILFGIGFDDLKYYKVGKNYASRVLESIWSYGFNVIGSVTYDSARYVADYIQKDDRSEMYDGRLPPFSLKSKGLGLFYAEDNKEQIIQNNGITIKGKEVGIPRYYQKKLDLNRDYFIEKAIEREKRQEEKYVGRSLKHKSYVSKERNNSRLQTEENYKKKLRLKEKGDF